MTEQPTWKLRVSQACPISSGGGSLQTILTHRLPAATERRRAAMPGALAEMKSPQDSIVRIDDELLNFLAQEIGDQMMEEVARRWRASKMGFPTVLKAGDPGRDNPLAIAVATLDQ